MKHLKKVGRKLCFFFCKKKSIKNANNQLTDIWTKGKKRVRYWKILLTDTQ